MVFVSDRDGSAGNLFVLELVTREITQVTHELSAAGRPTWSPDGNAIAYLSFVGEWDSPQPWKIGPRPRGWEASIVSSH